MAFNRLSRCCTSAAAAATVAHLLLLCQVHTSAAVTCPSKCNCTTVIRKGGVNRFLVDCSGKGLADIPDGIPSEAGILDLNNNNIAQIAPGKLGSLSKLVEMHMAGNELTKISAGALKGLASLQLLYLTRNKLTDFPDLCGDVGPTLTHLGIDENKLDGSSVPASYAKCTGLLSLVLTKNQFPRLTNATLAPLKLSGKLQSIKLNDVHLADMDSSALLPLTDSLMNLDLSSNQNLPADSLAAAFAKAAFSIKFVGLTLKSTGWTTLPAKLLPRGHFPSLDILHLDGSGHLKSISAGALDGGSSLTQLYLNGCPIASLDGELSGLVRLRQLSLSRSGLTSWTAKTFGLSLKQLDLSGSAVAFIGGLAGDENPLPHLASLDANGLRIGGNPLVCNCSQLWLTQQLQNAELRKKFYKLDDVTCTDPVHGSTIKLTDCKPTGCNETTTTTASTSTTTPTTTSTSTSTSASTSFSTTAGIATSTTDAATTSPHGGEAPRTVTLPVWLVGVIAGCGGLTLLLALLGFGLWLRSRSRQVADDADLRDLLGEGRDRGGRRRGCLEMLPSLRRGHVQVPADYVDDVA